MGSLRDILNKPFQILPSCLFHKTVLIRLLRLLPFMSPVEHLSDLKQKKA